MSVEQLQQQLGECFNGSQDPNVQQAAQTANQYTEMFKAGQLSKDEYTQLIADIARTNEINKSVDNQQVLEYMNVAINGLITLASLAA
jgi:hypothetical protein